jgi:predicted nicotinamide N-methyase
MDGGMPPQQEHEAAFRDVRVVQNTTKVDGLGGEVWAGALVLCEFLELNQDVVQGRDVIELGAGCGLCGLVAASNNKPYAFRAGTTTTRALLAFEVAPIGTKLLSG